MTENILIYLVTMNVIILILLYFLSRKLENYRESLDEFASYLYSIQEEFKGDDDDSRTRTSDVDK